MENKQMTKIMMKKRLNKKKNHRMHKTFNNKLKKKNKLLFQNQKLNMLVNNVA